MELQRVRLGLATFGDRGRGLIAYEQILSGSVIDAAPVLIVPPIHFKFISDPKNGLLPLKSHMVIWDRNISSGEETACISFGLLSFCNHSQNPNAKISIDHRNEIVNLLAIQAIAAMDEITIRYKNPAIINISNWQT